MRKRERKRKRERERERLPCQTDRQTERKPAMTTQTNTDECEVVKEGLN